MQHQSLVREIAEEVILIQESLIGKQLPHKKLINGIVEGIKDCPHVYCLCRSALSRLKTYVKLCKGDATYQKLVAG